LDVARLRLTRDRARLVNIYAAHPFDTGPRFSLAAIGNEVGIVCYDGRADGSRFREQVIALARTRSFGTGDRVWLTCACERRVTKLYLPPGELRFACADCHDVQLGHDRGVRLRWHEHELRKTVLDWTEPLADAV
jgi:hypothetical protein